MSLPTPRPIGKNGVLIHGTCVSFDNRAVLICGAAGSGKSSLALQLIGLGARLVADDQTILSEKSGALMATCPDALKGLIEARGVGVMRVDHQSSAVVELVVDLNELEEDRLPERRQASLLGIDLPLAFRVDAPHFAVSLSIYLKNGRHD